MNPPGLHSAPFLHANAKRGDRINCQHAHTTCSTSYISACSTSSLPFARQPVPSTIDELFESTNHQMDIHQPPPNVVDYWFDQLGLSLDPISSETPSNATDSPFQFTLFDGINFVSSLLPILCHTTTFRLVLSSEGISDLFSIVRLWNCQCWDKLPRKSFGL